MMTLKQKWTDIIDTTTHMRLIKYDKINITM